MKVPRTPSRDTAIVHHVLINYGGRLGSEWEAIPPTHTEADVVASVLAHDHLIVAIDAVCIANCTARDVTEDIARLAFRQWNPKWEPWNAARALFERYGLDWEAEMRDAAREADDIEAHERSLAPSRATHL